MDDSKDKKAKPPAVKASIALEWKPPRGVAEPIPQRNLTPNRFPETYVSTTPFPPDDRSVGYKRGTSISKAWEQSTTDGAIEAAAYVASHLRELSGAKEGAADEEALLRDFARRFAKARFDDRSPRIKRSSTLTADSKRRRTRGRASNGSFYSSSSRLGSFIAR